MNEPRQRIEEGAPCWRRRRSRDDTPFRLENLRTLGRPAPPPPVEASPAPVMTWRPELLAAPAPRFDARAFAEGVRFRSAPSLGRGASLAAAEVPAAPDLRAPDAELASSPLGIDESPRASRRLVAAARLTLAAAVLCLAALVAVLCTEPGLVRPRGDAQLSELQVLSRPMPWPSADGRAPAAGEARGPAGKIASLAEASSLQPLPSAPAGRRPLVASRP